MRSHAHPGAFLRAVRVAPGLADDPGTFRLLLETPFRLPLEVVVSRRAFFLLGLEAQGASPQRQRQLALDLLAGSLPGAAADIATELAGVLWPDLCLAAGAVAFCRLGARGVAACSGRLFPCARAGLRRGEPWPRRR